jgi:hypothetical protein
MCTVFGRSPRLRNGDDDATVFALTCRGSQDGVYVDVDRVALCRILTRDM